MRGFSECVIQPVSSAVGVVSQKVLKTRLPGIFNFHMVIFSYYLIIKNLKEMCCLALSSLFLVNRILRLVLIIFVLYWISWTLLNFLSDLLIKIKFFTSFHWPKFTTSPQDKGSYPDRWLSPRCHGDAMYVPPVVNFKWKVPQNRICRRNH